MARGQRDPGRERFWREALRRRKASGLTVRAFCAKEGLAETAYHAWRRTLRERDAERRPAPVSVAPAFVPVVVREDRREADGQIVVELRGGRVMRLPTSTPADRLAAIVRAIEAAGGGGAA